MFIFSSLELYPDISLQPKYSKIIFLCICGEFYMCNAAIFIQVSWLKIELCKLLEEKRSADLRFGLYFFS
jgi:hypothetical protein